MTKKKIQEKEILKSVKMDASVNFMAGGDILVVPCPWESEKEVTNGGKRVRYRAGIKVDADGRTRVTRILDGSRGPLHETLFETAHGAVKMTRPMYYTHGGGRRLNQEFVYVTFKFPKKYGATLVRSCFREEMDEVMSFLKTRKEETLWG